MTITTSSSIRRRLGFFGFFESIRDPEVAEIASLEGAGLAERAGDGKDGRPDEPFHQRRMWPPDRGLRFLPLSHDALQPPYYASLLEGWGLKKAMDLYAYCLEESLFLDDRLIRITERIDKEGTRLRIRPINLRRFDEELTIVKEIYNDAWSKNWGFVPLTDAEIDDLGQDPEAPGGP